MAPTPFRHLGQQFCHPHLLQDPQMVGLSCLGLHSPMGSEHVHLNGNCFCSGETQRSSKIFAGDHGHCPPHSLQRIPGKGCCRQELLSEVLVLCRSVSKQLGQPAWFTGEETCSEPLS